MELVIAGAVIVAVGVLIYKKSNAPRPPKNDIPEGTRDDPKDR